MRKKEENLNTASGLRIAMILLGIAVTPVLLSSSSLGNQLSSSSLISVVLLGGVILTLLSAITISVGEKARLPTYGIVKYSFGEKGAIAINILMAISLFGWLCHFCRLYGIWLCRSGKNCPGCRAGYRAGAVLHPLCGNP